MSNKQDKKRRQVIRKNVKVQLQDVGLSLQKIITSFPFRKRAGIAWNILKGKSFLKGGELNRKNEANR